MDRKDVPGTYPEVMMNAVHIIVARLSRQQSYLFSHSYSFRVGLAQLMHRTRCPYGKQVLRLDVEELHFRQL